MKRFLSVFAVAALLTGFASCSNDDEPKKPSPEEAQEVLEDLFGSNVPDFIKNEDTPPVEVRPNSTASLAPFEASYPWKVSVATSMSRSAKSSLGTRAGEAQYMLSQSPEGTNPNTEFSGSGDGSMVQLYLVTPADKPESGAIGAEVTLSVTDKAGQNYSWTMYEAYINSGTNSFAIFAGIPIDPLPEDGNPWEMDSEDQYKYEGAATTTLNLIEGDGVPQVRFLVDSDNPWIVSDSDNLPLYFYPSSGNAGETGVFAIVNGEQQPIEDTDVEVKFIENTESSNAATLGTVTIPVPGCGNTVNLFGYNFSSEILIDRTGSTVYSEGANYWLPIGEEGQPLYVEAAYGSQIYFASEGNWIEFVNEITFAETDGDIDLTKYGLQRVGGQFEADLNEEPNTRTAYLIGVPANKVAEVGVAPENAIVNGKLNSKLEEYILSTITQKAYLTDGEAWELVNWADSSSDLGYDRGDMADLFIIRQASEVYQELFVQDWKSAPVAFGISYTSIQAPEYAGTLRVSSDITSAKFYGLYTPYQLASGYQAVDWANIDLSNGILEIHPNYNYETGEWNVQLPEEIDLANLTGYISLYNSDNEVVTFIQIVVDATANSSDPTNPTQKIAGAWGWIGEAKTSLPLRPLGAADEGYDPDYYGEQYSLPMDNFGVVSFDVVPTGNPLVFDAVSGAELDGVFYRTSPESNYFILEPTNDKGAIYVVFSNAGVQLYVTYNYAEDDTEGFTLTELNTDNASESLSALSSDSPNYNSSLTGVDAQYYAKLAGAPAYASLVASKSAAELEFTLHYVAVDGVDKTSMFLNNGEMIEDEISVSPQGNNAAIYFPYPTYSTVDAPTGNYDIVFYITDSTGYTVSLSINVDVE